MFGKYSLTKFANFFIIVLRAEIVTTFGSKMVTISTRNTKYNVIQNIEASQGYIFRILQDFAIKFWHFTSFERFFPVISFFSSGFVLIKN